MFLNDKHRNYVIYLIIYSLVIGLVSFVTPLWVLEKTHSPFIVSIISSATIITSAVISPLAGALGDRYSKVNIIIIGCSIIGLASLLIYISSYEIFIFTIISVLLITRIAGLSLVNPINNAILSEVIEYDNLTEAVSLNQVIVQISQTLTPLLGSLAIIYFSYRTVYVIECIAIIILIFLIKSIKSINDSSVEKKREKFLESFLSGFQIIMKSSKIFSFILIAAIINIIGASMVLAIQTELVLSNTSKFWYGIIFASSPVGVIIGAAISRRIKWGTRLIYISFIFVALMACSNLLMSLSMDNLYIFTFLFFVSGIFFGFSNVYFGILYRTEISLEEQGRFFGFLSSFMIISIPLGTILNGALLEYYDPSAIIFYLALMTIIISILSAVYFKRKISF
ncbi:MFS transporter [Macrococcoides canis]|uniref:MFS transporter n=1 Tax=Macrococcoides canis TaxID=1855823 RepID=UPI00207C1A61|nr:MFS transporter [Macrococcus canis]MCO4097692.1 MFS transporter [Macrococcus canis]UTH08871.1 MFS transporter [Macrococcus canis]